MSLVLGAEGKPAEALVTIRRILADGRRLPVRHPFGKLSLVRGVEAALEADDLEAAEAILGEWEPLRPVDRTPFLDAQHARLAARLAARRGADPDDSETTRAEGILRELEMQFHLSVTLLEHGERLAEQGRADEAEPLLAEAYEIFDRLQARPWLERAAQARAARRQTEALT